MKTDRFLLLAGSAVLFAVSAPALAQTAAPKYGTFGVDLSAQKAGVKPGDDFWTYANGAWAARTKIPDDKGSVGYGNILSDEAEVNVRKILDDMAISDSTKRARSSIMSIRSRPSRR